MMYLYMSQYIRKFSVLIAFASSEGSAYSLVRALSTGILAYKPWMKTNSQIKYWTSIPLDNCVCFLKIVP